MKLLQLIIVNLVVVLTRSANVQPENQDVICITPECRQLPQQNRMETIEMAIRTIVTALSSQTSDLFALIKTILEKDLAVRSILSATPIRQNTTTFSSASSAGGIKNTENTLGSRPNPSSAQITKGYYSESLQQGKNMVDQLKGVVKCSLAHLVDISTIDFESNPSNNSSLISASITSNDSLEIIWPALSSECLQYSSGVWIRLYQIGYELKSPVETSLAVPHKCIKKKSQNTYSLVLSPPSSNAKKGTCFFSLAKNLTQCRSYAVEVIPNFQTLRGKTLRTTIVIPPKQSDDSKSLMNVSVHPNSLKLNWKDNSGCAPQMTSLNLQILQDGSADVERSNSTVRIPRSCLKQDANEENTFSVVLPFNSQTCPIEWKPLDRCRKYTFDMSSQYTETWNGPTISANVFTRGNEANFSFESNSYNSWLCPKKHFICNHGCASSEHGRIAAYVCNGENNCIAGRDENYCDQNICKDGFKCGRQCIPKELVCNGQHDCVDGSDEEYSSCTYSNVCQHFTNSSGSFSSLTFPKPANEIHSERDFDAARKNSVLISVQPNHQIWLAFEKCVTFENQHFVNIYDGPYSTSPLLLSYSGSVKPFSVRSSSNDLYVEFPSYYYPNYGITAFYTSMKSTNESFVPDCGGYINGEGIISTPNYLLNTNISDCYWFIDARQNEDTILLAMSNSALLSSSQELGAASISEVSSDDDYANNYYDQITTTSSTTMLPPRSDPLAGIIVYDGWSSSGTVLYDSETFNEQRGKNIYSISNKMMVRSKAPVVRSNFVSSLKVSKISTPQCNHKFEEPNGIIKSPNYPLLYPNATDCRWSIEVDPSSKIRLLFAFFETQEGADFLYVYDGPTVYSNLLFEKSGSVKTPFQVDSTTNKILIRFTSDGEISFPGFLNVYSSV